MLVRDKASGHRSLSPKDRAPGRSDDSDSMPQQVAQIRGMLMALVNDMKDVKGTLVSDKVGQNSDVMKDVDSKLISGNHGQDAEGSRLVLPWQ